MLARKMDAIKCILRKAESTYEEFEYNETYALSEFQYYSSKYSQFEGKAIEELPENMREDVRMYLNFTLNPDTHFYNISVDTEHSSVHVPTNVYDRGELLNENVSGKRKLRYVFANSRVLRVARR